MHDVLEKWYDSASCSKIIGRGYLKYYTMGGARFPEAVPIFLGKIAWGVPGCKISCGNVGKAQVCLSVANFNNIIEYESKKQ